MTLRPLFVLCLLFGLTVAGGARADELRFSKTLTAEESKDLGLAALDSDQTAALDALVRRDIAAADYVYKTPRAARFSERLTPEERRAAGLASLDAATLARLDAAVERLMPAPRTPIGSAALARAESTAAVVPSLTLRRRPEIHGSVTLMAGMGSGGYSELGGALVLTYDDPEHDFSLLVGYSEVHTKGGNYWRRHGYGYRGGDCFPDLLLP